MALTWLPDEYIRAYRFAAYAHQGESLTGTDLPYIVHVSLVAMEVLAAIQVEPGFDGDLAVQCAILHDVLEDTRVTPAQLSCEFGERIARGVAALTKDRSLEKPRQMGDSLRRIREQPREVWMVKLADRITNLQPPPPTWNESKICEYRCEAVEIHSTLKSASPYLAARLESKIKVYPGRQKEPLSI